MWKPSGWWGRQALKDAQGNTGVVQSNLAAWAADVGSRGRELPSSWAGLLEGVGVWVQLHRDRGEGPEPRWVHMSVAWHWETVTRLGWQQVSEIAPAQQNSCLEKACFCTCVINLFRISEVWKVVFFLVYGKEAEAWTGWVTDCWRSRDLSVGRTTVCVCIIFPSTLTGTDYFWWLFHVCSFWWHKCVLVVKKKRKKVQAS